MNCVLAVKNRANPGPERFQAYVEVTFNDFASERA